MKSMIISFMIIFLNSVLPLSAKEFLVEYLEGILEVKEASNWATVEIGDTIPAESYLRLSDNGFTELSTGNITITLNVDGTYSTEELLRSGKVVASWKIGDLINSKLKKLISSGPTSGKSAVMGVRGAAQTEQSLEWIDESGEYLKEGKELLKKGNIEAAIATFLEGADYSFGEQERQEYLFYAAYGYAERGSNALALKNLVEVSPEPDASYFMDFVLLKGRLLIENLAFKEALKLFDRYLDNAKEGEVTQIVYFLSALCYQGLDNKQEALKNLKAAHAIDMKSEYGRAAKRMMDSL